MLAFRPDDHAEEGFLNAEKFVRDAWATTDQEARKLYVRAHVTKVALPDLETVVLRELDRAGWNVGMLMVAQRVLQVVPSEKIMHHLLGMVSSGAGPVPNGPTLHKQLRANLDHLASRNAALADAQKRFGKPKKPAKAKAGRIETPTETAASAKPAAAATTAKSTTAAKSAPAKPSAKPAPAKASSAKSAPAKSAPAKKSSKAVAAKPAKPKAKSNR
ncbi:hypothetical protein BH09MYX1_BH09MYX1_12930 [soil metagenome]